MTCQCGCGQATSLSKKTYTRDGLRKGEPNRFLPGHARPKQRVLGHQCPCGAQLVAISGTRRYCDMCSLERRRLRDKTKQKARRARNGHKERYRAYSLQRNYGLTIEEYQALFESQGCACAICHRTDPGWSKDWHIDHDHATNKVRGVLCHFCNLMLGSAHDCPEVLRTAATYLEKL